MKKTLSMILAVATALIALTGCSSYTLTNSESYVGANLSSYHTFRIVTPAEGKLPPGMSMVTYYNIAAAIREQLTERGLTEEPNSPLLVNIGLTVNKDLVNVPVTQTVPTGGTVVVPTSGPVVPPPGAVPPPSPEPGPVIPQRPGRPLPPPGHGPAMNGMLPVFMYPRSYYWPNYTTITQWVPSIYKEGVLTMDLVDTSKDIPVYTASVATILDNGSSQLQTLSGITKAVAVLFSKFPIPIQK